jgi:hypothetical protein
MDAIDFTMVGCFAADFHRSKRDKNYEGTGTSTHEYLLMNGVC